VTGTDRFAVVEPFLLSQASGGAPRPVSAPAPTFATSGAVSLVEPFVVPYYGTSRPTPVAAPLPTVTTRDRFGLVEHAGLDIRFRMLQPHELAAAMGFPTGYRFAGNRADQVRQIGNAVCVGVADALCTAALQEVA
jgi:DNA (cytosine-5)-methyltransferase 1